MMSCGSPSSVSPGISDTDTISNEITSSIPVPSSRTLTQPTDTSTQPLITVNKEFKVFVNSNGFTPNIIDAPLGTIVIWQNSEPRFQGCCPRCHINHTVTSDTGVLDSGDLGIYAHYFGDAGIFVYHDSLYPELTGTVIVSDASSTQYAPATGNNLPRTGGGSLVGSVIFADDTYTSENMAWLFPSNNLNVAYASVNIESNGVFTFSDIPPGTYTIFITAMKGNIPFYFKVSKESVIITENATVTLDNINIPKQ